MKPTVVAMYLPQYHPTKENDEWWEPGFTEWTNVTKAKPLYRGHQQPNLPSELGFYDLRVPETREKQAKLAKEYGVDAFCYYHYWFGNGQRILERPFSEVLHSGTPDFPFMLCWANQTWSGVWHGLNNRVLAEQLYPGSEDYKLHFESLLPAFKDPRYLKVKGKPIFMVYQPDDIPDSNQFCKQWRELAVQHGLPGLHIIGHHADPNWPAESRGFDAFVLVPYFPKRREWTSWRNPILKIKNKLLSTFGIPTILSYEGLHKFDESGEISSKAIPCVIPNWDNTPRSGALGVVYKDATPLAFSHALDMALRFLQRTENGERYLFIKSWNEWAEGNTLEPSRKWGRSFLEVLRKGLQLNSKL